MVKKQLRQNEQLDSIGYMFRSFGIWYLFFFLSRPPRHLEQRHQTRPSLMCTVLTLQSLRVSADQAFSSANPPTDVQPVVNRV